MSASIPNAAAPCRILRLRPSDRRLAKQLFAMMARVFQEDCHELSDAYVDGLLKRDEFWALAAVSGEHVVGGLTAHTLPMTRTGVPEVFLYDLAVRTDRQRRGIGRQLVRHLREAAAEVGIGELFVPVDVAHEHARHFYRALGGAEAPVAFFTFSGSPS